MKRQRCKMKRKDLRENSGNIEIKQGLLNIPWRSLRHQALRDSILIFNKFDHLT